MCMKGTTEGCVLLERMTKVEVRQNIIMWIVVLMFATVVFMAFKMLNAQIYLLTGGDGLREISTETRSDVKAVKQISGAIARRIVCEAEPGTSLKRGEQYGMIKFGSRTEVYLPAQNQLDIKINVGDKVQGGLSILAQLKSSKQS